MNYKRAALILFLAATASLAVAMEIPLTQGGTGKKGIAVGFVDMDLIFQQFPANGKLGEEPHCENAVYKRKKWIKVKDRDLTGILWLKDSSSRSTTLGSSLRKERWSCIQAASVSSR